MRTVKDTGDGEEDDEDLAQEEERIMHGTRVTGPTTSDAVVRQDPWAVAGSNPNGSRLSPTMGGTPRLSSMLFPGRNYLMTPPRSFDSFGSGSMNSFDSAWQAPDLPRSAFLGNNFGVLGRQHGFGMGSSTKRVIRKNLPAPENPDDEDEDVLLGVSGNAFKQKDSTKTSPLIKEKFPTVDSSPNNDSGLNALIQEVIENIPETPPSVQRPMASKLGMKRQPLGRSKLSQPALEPKGKPRGRETGQTRKGGSIGARLDVSQESDHASLSGSPTRSIKARRNKSLAGRAGLNTQANGPGKEASIYKQADLERYEDVTGMPATKLAARQALYVAIESKKVDVLDAKRHAPKCSQMEGDKDASASQGQATTAVLTTEPKKRGPKPSTAQGTLERNAIDPAFTFSDEESLPSRKIIKDRRKSEPAKLAAPQALQASRLNPQQPPAKDIPERNVVDPSFQFSDEENLLPKRIMATGREPKPAASPGVSVGEGLSIGRKPKDGSASEPTKMRTTPSERKGKRQSMRSARNSNVAVAGDIPVDGADGSVPPNALPAGSEPQGTPSLNRNVLRSRTQRQGGTVPTTITIAASVSVHNEQPVSQETETAKPGSQPGTVKRRPSRPRKVQRIASPELGDFTPPAIVGPATAEVEKGKPKTRQPLLAATSAPPQQPSTPQTKSKANGRQTPTSRPGLISLLSDNEDDEDEISFDLSAFTPSGHHRILAHRHLTNDNNTTPHTALNSTASKKKRASSLLFGPSSTSKVRKHRTPGPERGKERRAKRRGSTNDLASSMVKVRRKSFRAPSPAGSVVQTPGGTRRRCGEEGFTCGRDFCFVCISI